MRTRNLKILSGAFLVISLVSLVGCAGQKVVDAAPKNLLAQDLFIEASNNRRVPVKIYLPEEGCQHCTLIVFSHGAFSAPERYELLLKTWAQQGYVIASPVHVDSELYPESGKYAQADWARTRIEDYEKLSSALLNGRIELEGVQFSGKLIATGHSFGALVAQIASGAEMDGATGAALSDDKLNPLGVIAISPPGPIPNYITPEGWAQINRPMLVVTGTEDVIPGFTPGWEMHLESYKAVSEGLAYALVFDGIDHYFNGAFGRARGEGFQENQELVLLNGIVLDFISALESGQQISKDQWKSLSAQGLEALSR